MLLYICLLQLPKTRTSVVHCLSSLAYELRVMAAADMDFIHIYRLLTTREWVHCLVCKTYASPRTPLASLWVTSILFTRLGLFALKPLSL